MSQSSREGESFPRLMASSASRGFREGLHGARGRADPDAAEGTINQSRDALRSPQIASQRVDCTAIEADQPKIG
jgi:hypothetical protein